MFTPRSSSNMLAAYGRATLNRLARVIYLRYVYIIDTQLFNG